MTEAIKAFRSALGDHGVHATLAQIADALDRAGVRMEMTGKQAAIAHLTEVERLSREVFATRG